MDKKPTNSFWSLVLQTVFVVSSVVFYGKVKNSVDKVSVTIVSTIFRILGFGGIAKMLKPDKNPNEEFDDEEFDDEEFDDEEFDDEEFDDDSLFLD